MPSLSIFLINKYSVLHDPFSFCHFFLLTLVITQTFSDQNAYKYIAASVTIIRICRLHIRLRYINILLSLWRSLTDFKFPNSATYL